MHRPQQSQLLGSGAQAEQLRHTGLVWDLPRSGIEPMSSAFSGGFFATEPSGKPHIQIFIN